MLIIYTGDGKGKTTAALGQAIRAAGQELKVCFVQFIKGKWQTGEVKFITAFQNRIELHTLGSGFTWQADDKDEVIATAKKAWQFAKNKISDSDYDMIVLDELTYLIRYGIVDEQEVLAVMEKRPGRQHVVITGRNASAGLIAVADLVTEMKEVKHPYQSGRKAQKGIEF